MNTTFCRAIIATACLVNGPSLSWAGDDLFSSIATESVFSDSKVRDDNRESVNRTSRIAGASSLIRLLKKADISAKQVTSQVVSLKISRDDWSIPVLISVSIDKNELEVVLLLSEVDDEANLSTAKLLELMNVSRDRSPVFFAYSAKRKRIELHQVISSVGVTSAKIERMLDNLAEIASDTETSWTIDTDSATKEAVAEQRSEPEGSDVETANPTISLTNETLVGVWSASRSDRDAFALQILSGGKFALAVVSGKTSSKSSGKFELSGSKITLNADDGTKLQGTLRMSSKNQFELTILGNENGKPLKFNRATS